MTEEQVLEAWREGRVVILPEKPVARVVSGVQDYPTADHREVKPAVASVDGEYAAHPAREKSKVDGTFGVDLPYEQRQR